MNRRTFLGALTGILTQPAWALAKTKCRSTSQGQLCISEVNFKAFQQHAYKRQQKSQWCWAACISMLFTYYGHPVSQRRIVEEVYGNPVNMPAKAGIVMARQLNREWVDDRGKSFTSTLTAVYDFAYKVFAIEDRRLIDELDSNHPLVIGAGHHAMVLTSVQYYRTPKGPRLISGGVFDPWPGRGPRSLIPRELVFAHQGGLLHFAATVKVAPVQSSRPTK